MNRHYIYKWVSFQSAPTLRQLWHSQAAPAVRRVALAALDDETLLTEVALNSDDATHRATAGNRLKSPAALARVLLASSDPAVRRGLVSRVKDQATLVELAQRETDIQVQRALAAALTDDAALGALALRSKDEAVQCVSLAGTDDRGALQRLVDAKLANTYLNGLAALKLMLLEARVQARFLKPAMSCQHSVVSHAYRRRLGSGGVRVEGQKIKIRLLSNGRELITRSWTAKFPSVLSGKPRRPLQAQVDMAPIISAAIEAAQLTQEEMVSMVLSSKARDMRRAAIGKLSDRPLLQHLVDQDTDSSVRSAAKTRLKALAP